MRAYGVPESVIVLKYALKPACIPTLAILGIGVGELLGGAVFAEVIFNRPGLGSLIYGAIAVRNYPVVQGGVLVVVLLFVATNFLVDLSYLWIDPRARARLALAGERSA
jgi:peptide/nickel transport system permease protein